MFKLSANTHELWQYGLEGPVEINTKGSFYRFRSISNLYDRADNDGSVGYSFTYSVGEENDGDVLLNPITDVDIPTSSERLRTPDDALTASAQEILSRSRRKSSHRNIYLKCFITWVSQSLRKKFREFQIVRRQMNDAIATLDGKTDLSKYIMSLFHQIFEYKSSYYSFYLTATLFDVPYQKRLYVESYKEDVKMSRFLEF
nr:chrysanthemyl diphosphate synthase [Tanacetum cinerariifolium]